MRMKILTKKIFMEVLEIFLILLDLNDNQIILEVKEENKNLIEEYDVFILALSMTPKDFMVSQLFIDSFIFRIH